MTTSPINLNKVRKAKVRAEAETKATENRAKFGRTKAQKQADALNAVKTIRDFEGHKREN